MNLDLNLPLNTRLHDVNFAIQYKLLCNDELHSKKHSDALAANIISLTERARKEQAADQLHDSVYRFYIDNLNSLSTIHSKKAQQGKRSGKKNTHIRFSHTIESFLENYDKYSEFMAIALYTPVLHNLALSYLPIYFEKHGLDGFEIELTEHSLDEISHTKSMVWFCVSDIKSNCMSAGYLHNAITIRASVPKGDTKLLSCLRERLDVLRLSTTKPERIKLENDFHIYEIKVVTSQQDKEILKASDAGIAKYREAYKQNAGLKAKYVFYAEGEPLADVGFANLKEVQSFLEIVNHKLVAIQDGDAPELMYYNNFMHLISIHDKNGPIDISRFKFPKGTSKTLAHSTGNPVIVSSNH